ncbi:MAG: hypothetical protein ACTSVZ_10395, partial [Promethearchaeota archaeon]
LSESVSHLATKNQYYKDLNSVFIPFRPVLEMELLVSQFLVHENYSTISKKAHLQPNYGEMQTSLCVDKGGNLNHDILDRFYHLVHHIKPIILPAREHHDRVRYGNVNAYTRSRIAGFYALDHFKFKILLLKNFLTTLAASYYNMAGFKNIRGKERDISELDLGTALYQEFHARSLEYFKLISPEKEIANRHKNVFTSVSFSALEKMCQFSTDDKSDNNVNYIMRSLKSSLFVCTVIFSHMDVPHPFDHKDSHMIDFEQTLLSPEFIPKLITSMTTALKNQKYFLLADLHKAFDFLIDRVIDGIDQAIRIAANHQLRLEREQTLYYVGNLLDF